MSACGCSHDTDTVGVDTPFPGMFAYQADGLLGIRQGNLVVPVRHAVLQYRIRDALRREPGRHVVPFVVHGKTGVSAAGAHNDGHTVGLCRTVNGYGRMGHVGNAAAFQIFLFTGQPVCIGSSVGPQRQFDGTLCGQHRCGKQKG